METPAWYIANLTSDTERYQLAARIVQLERRHDCDRALGDGVQRENNRLAADVTIARERAVDMERFFREAVKDRDYFEAEWKRATASLETLRRMPEGWRRNAGFITILELADSVDKWFRDGMPPPSGRVADPPAGKDGQ